MKLLKLSLLTISFTLIHHFAFGHCQVPCGIYTDQIRFEQMLEDQSTIEKASRMIKELSSKKDPQSKNQLIRWVQAKELHASNIQKVIAEYFLTQRIKPTSKNYTEQLKEAHKVMINAMKCKQSIDNENANSLKESIMSFSESYENKK
jgi:nickel superoxide dismutase